MKKKGTRFFLPESINELGELIVNEQDITLLAGGTSIFRDKEGDNLDVPGALINLNHIDDFKKESRTERYFEYGSMVTIEEIIKGSNKYLPELLLKALKSVAPYPVRNIATIGGTISNKKIVSDLIPTLLIFNCKVEVLTFPRGKRKTRWESINQYISTRDDRDLHIITRVRIPLASPGYYNFYKTGYKYNIGSEISFSGIADIEKKSISTISMAFNIENRDVIRLREIEAFLIGIRIPMGAREKESLRSKCNDVLQKKYSIHGMFRYQINEIIVHFIGQL